MMQEMRSNPFVHFAIFGVVDDADIYTMARDFLHLVTSCVMKKDLVANAIQNVFDMYCIQSLKPLHYLWTISTDSQAQAQTTSTHNCRSMLTGNRQKSSAVT